MKTNTEDTIFSLNGKKGQYDIKKTLTPDEIFLLAKVAAENLFKNYEDNGTVISCVDDFKVLLKNIIGYGKDEHFYVVYMDNKHRVIKHEIAFSGGPTSSAVHPRVIARKCLELNASAICIAHNHPAGDVTPSEEDKRTTTKIKEVCNLIEVRLLDHFIVGNKEDITSFAELGLL